MGRGSVIEYEDFEVVVTGEPGAYLAVVAESPGGEGEEPLRLDLAAPELQRHLAAFERLSGATRELVRRKTQTGPVVDLENTATALGRWLFDSLVVGDIRRCWDTSVERARKNGTGLRVKLSFSDPAVAQLPWEVLADPRGDGFIAERRTSPVVRHLRGPGERVELEVPAPLRILGMVSAPTDLEPLNTQEESARVERALRLLTVRRQVELEWVEGGTRAALMKALRTGPWHIVHFIGHGGYDAATRTGFVALEPEDPASPHEQLEASELARLLGNDVAIRLVVLNSCSGSEDDGTAFSSAAATLVQSGVPAVVAMRYPILDRAAIEFATVFYESLVDRLPVDAAVTEARVKLRGDRVGAGVDWAKPTLFMRAKDGVLFPGRRPTTAVEAWVKWGTVAVVAAVAAFAIWFVGSPRVASAEAFIRVFSTEVGFRLDSAQEVFSEQLVGSSIQLSKMDALVHGERTWRGDPTIRPVGGGDGLVGTLPGDLQVGSRVMLSGSTFYEADAPTGDERGAPTGRRLAFDVADGAPRLRLSEVAGPAEVLINYSPLSGGVPIPLETGFEMLGTSTATVKVENPRSPEFSPRIRVRRFWTGQIHAGEAGELSQISSGLDSAWYGFPDSLSLTKAGQKLTADSIRGAILDLAFRPDGAFHLNVVGTVHGLRSDDELVMPCPIQRWLPFLPCR